MVTFHALNILRKIVHSHFKKTAPGKNFRFTKIFKKVKISENLPFQKRSLSENSECDESKSVDSLSLASRDRGLSLDDMAAHEDGYMTDSTMFTIHDDDENIEVRNIHFCSFSIPIFCKTDHTISFRFLSIRISYMILHDSVYMIKFSFNRQQKSKYFVIVAA